MERQKNPSYVSPAAFEIFKDLDDAEFWNKALTINYTLLKNNQNSTTGLPTDWCSTSGNPVEEKEFGYDASRAPWRWAWANAWYGHEDAKTLLAKIAPWVNGKTPANINGPLDASNGNNKGGCCNNSTFLGPLTNALSYSSSYQAKMNSFWNTLMEKSDESYFNAAMQLITGLLASGNMPNLKAMSDGTPILLPQIVQGNTLNAMQNAIYLQVAKNANLEVFSLNGNFIRKFEFSKGAYSVPLGDLPKGIYVVMASFGNEKRVLHIPIR